MLKRGLTLIIIATILTPAVFAQITSEQEYINLLNYQRNKLELVTKKRTIDETRRYSYTDIDTYTFSYEAYTQSSTDISTQALSRREAKEISEWYIYKGGVRELSDTEFLSLVGENALLDKILKEEGQKAGMRNIGNVLIGTGLIVMIGAAATSAGSATVSGGAIGMTLGFFLNAFNRSPEHYIKPDFALEKIDEYNVKLKQELGLPINL
jgi:hypothetical protein